MEKGVRLRWFVFLENERRNNDSERYFAVRRRLEKMLPAASAAFRKNREMLFTVAVRPALAQDFGRVPRQGAR